MNNKYDISNSLKTFERIKNELTIKFFGDPSLRTICEDVTNEEFGSTNINKVCDDLVSVISKYRKITGTGRGIAANQIGYNKNIIVTWLEDRPEIFINLKVLNSKGKGSYWETCMSSGGMLTGEVIRAWMCTFEYKDVQGNNHTIDANEKQTRILLHELDHLKGIICLDKYEPTTSKYVFGGAEEILKFPFKRIDNEK